MAANTSQLSVSQQNPLYRTTTEVEDKIFPVHSPDANLEGVWFIFKVIDSHPYKHRDNEHADDLRMMKKE